jgi:hypothetical protein
VERTFAWLSQFRRLHVRYEKRTDIHEAFLSLVRTDLLEVPAEDMGGGLVADHHRAFVARVGTLQ